jgi:carbamoyl-phosphate synthase large subunit
MKRILLTASGGPATLSYTRSLLDADPGRKQFYIVGIDCDPYNIHRSEVDKSYLAPTADDPKYISFLCEIIRREKIDFLHSQPEIEAYIIGKHREQILSTGCRLFMPSQSSIEKLRNKWESYKIWSNAGILVPRNILLKEEGDLLKAYDLFGNDIWIREIIGAAGKGSMSRPSFETAKTQLDLNNSWGKAVAADHLTRETTTWQSLWYEGRLVAAQGRQRMSWAFGNRSQSGVTGLTGIGKTFSDPQLDDLAIDCIKSADNKPHGIFSVDFTLDNKGIPNPTEINIGKFFTTHHFITKAGCNMPYLMTQLAFGEYDGPFEILNPCDSDLYWIRGMDTTPQLIKQEEIDAKQIDYGMIIKKLKKQ